MARRYIYDVVYQDIKTKSSASVAEKKKLFISVHSAVCSAGSSIAPHTTEKKINL